MNCKPGDLAVIVKVGPLAKGLLGRFVTVLRPHKDSLGVYWDYEPLLQTVDGYVVAAVEDECLRPIRDPGEDAVDEMVQKLGKPQEVTA
jgi:hypothetical protein